MAESEVEQNIIISVVIPSYNEERHIERCLHSVLAQKIAEKYEVIVVDSSQDKTVEIIQANFPNVRLIRRAEQTYPGEARNIGVMNARGRIIAFLDGHCVADVYWLRNALRAMKEHDCFIVGGALRNNNSRKLVGVADFILAFNEFAEGMPSRMVDFMPTCNLVCTKEAFEEVGGFDVNLRAGEDTMFCYVAGKKGYSLYFDAQVLVTRTNRDSCGAFLRHHYTFGKYSAQVRKKVKLPGHIFARYPLLSLGVPLVRLLRISSRIIRWNRFMLPEFLLSFPLTFLGIMVWSWGFVVGSVRK